MSIPMPPSTSSNAQSITQLKMSGDKGSPWQMPLLTSMGLSVIVVQLTFLPLGHLADINGFGLLLSSPSPLSAGLAQVMIGQVRVLL